MRAIVKPFSLASAVLLCLLASAINSPLTLHSRIEDPRKLSSLVSVVAPPITAGGFLYDRTTGAMLYDSVTGAALFA